MNNLQVIEHSNQRVLTTSQLAVAYGTENRRISENFNRNKSRFFSGKHYVALEGEDKQAFLNRTQIADGSKNAQVLYLWTEKGAWLHAKSLNTDEAWDAYEMLVDEYYRIKEQEVDLSLLSPEVRALIKIEQKQIEHDKRLEKLETKQDNIVEIIALNPTEWRKKVNAIINRIARSIGGFESYQSVRNESYQRLEERAKCNLSIRLTNMQAKMALEGAPKSKVDKTNRMDVIAADARLTEIYLAIVKEMAVQHGVSADGLKEVG